MRPVLAGRAEHREIVDTALPDLQTEWHKMMRIKEAGAVIGKVAPLADNQAAVEGAVRLLHGLGRRL